MAVKGLWLAPLFLSDVWIKRESLPSWNRGSVKLVQGSALGKVFCFLQGSLFVRFVLLCACYLHHPTLICPPAFEVDIIPIAEMDKVRARKSHSGELLSHIKLGFESIFPDAESMDRMLFLLSSSDYQSYPFFRNRKGCWKLLSGSKGSQIPQLGWLPQHLPCIWHVTTKEMSLG